MDFDELFQDDLLHIHTAGRDNTYAGAGKFSYEPTAYRVLDRMHENGVFSEISMLVDLGCGKGRVSFYLAHYCKIASLGVESEAEFYEAAQENLAAFPERERIRFVHARAEEFEIPKEADAFFFFHPFSAEILRTVVSRIERSYRKYPRRIRLIFYYMPSDYVGVLKEVRMFRRRAKLDCRDLFKDNDARDFIYIYEGGV